MISKNSPAIASATPPPTKMLATAARAVELEVVGDTTKAMHWETEKRVTKTVPSRKSSIDAAKHYRDGRGQGQSQSHRIRLQISRLRR